MSAAMDPECPPLFTALGLSYDTGAAMGTQVFFRVQ
jgi:hypothetical protein